MTDPGDLAARLARRRRRQAWLNTVMVLGLVAAFAAIGLLLGARADTGRQVDLLRQQSAVNAEAAESNAAAADALADQVRSLGQRPVVEPDRLPEPVEERRGPGPTDAQIAAAVAAYCAGGRCAASGPTPQQVAAAIEAFCADDRCRGAEGAAGEDAEGPTADEIAATVAAYCADRDQCAGPPGTDGADGADGVDGQDGQDGQDGTDGAPPASFTFDDSLGREQECTRDDESPDDEPTYSCEPSD